MSTGARLRGRRMEFTVMLDPDQLEQVEAVATARRSSRAAIVREAVDIWANAKADEIEAARARANERAA